MLQNNKHHSCHVRYIFFYMYYTLRIIHSTLTVHVLNGCVLLNSTMLVVVGLLFDWWSHLYLIFHISVAELQAKKLVCSYSIISHVHIIFHVKHIFSIHSHFTSAQAQWLIIINCMFVFVIRFLIICLQKKRVTSVSEIMEQIISVFSKVPSQ